MRVASHDRLWRDMEKYQELKPMEPIDVRAMKEMNNFKVKIVDMGNACFANKKKSSVI